MKREAEKREEEQLKRPVSLPISMSNGGENLQSQIDVKELMYMDHSRNVRHDDKEDESAAVEVLCLPVMIETRHLLK